LAIWWRSLYVQCAVYIATGGGLGALVGLGLNPPSAQVAEQALAEATPTLVIAPAAVVLPVSSPATEPFPVPTRAPTPTFLPIPDPAPAREPAVSPFVPNTRPDGS